MQTEMATELVRESLWLVLLLSMPVLGAALVVGLAIGVMQAMTQIQEQSLSFVPKIIGMGVVAIIALPWIVTQTMDFAARMFSGQ